jgi:hydrogenase maturation protein HypF
MQIRQRITVSGIVQGVGFRPHVYRLAHRYALTGNVKNTVAGVIIEAQGTKSALAEFCASLSAEAPPLAKIGSVRVEALECQLEPEFVILGSDSKEPANTLIAPDSATCTDCLSELLDPGDRRYGYAFTNCTNCGPRFTILRHIPYDRKNTSMAVFPMCPLCQAEYDDPLSRRFHAQPNACWDCGPQLSLFDATGELVPGNSITVAANLLKAGRVLAIKGLGGFHLSADATNADAVTTLRQRKHRFEKPLAVMVADIAGAEKICLVTDADRALLRSPECPIVLMRAREDSGLADSIAPRNPDLGVFLPYTPVQHLLFAAGGLRALVMTSANLSEEPICIDNAEAMERLSGIADFILMHNREILLRCDDSLVRTSTGRLEILRRSRGFVPVPIALDQERPSVLAVGGELKNAICITKGKHAFLGQHVGDLENLSAYNFFQESITHLEGILEIQPTAIAYDLHPGYLSTQWALEQKNLPKVAVQHHHAHIASCMAENHLTGPVIGVVLDGTGYGSDGQVWGGEILVADFNGFRRAAHIEYVPLPGGAQAIREPWRMAVSHLVHAGGDALERALPYFAEIPLQQIELVERMVRQGINSPMTSSCGRLFDAVAALGGVRSRVNFEAQAAMELEACCLGDASLGEYGFAIHEGECYQIGTAQLFDEILRDRRAGVPPEVISTRFHRGLVSVLAKVVARIAADTGIYQVCVSGGCFLNRPLLMGLDSALKSLKIEVFMNSVVPCGDGGISLGQAVITASGREA